ncbi:MAG: CpaF family protein [Bacilli bacterium]|nr:CpaF family protein [Bacilli bacterium]
MGKIKKSFSSEFQIDTSKKEEFVAVSDYNVFHDKKMLDDLRNRIIQNIIDNNIPKDMNLNDYINMEIDNSLNGVEISNFKRNHIFNLIDNEINGLGPITELLKDKNITEIMVNAPNEVYVEIDGKLVRDESISFINSDHILRTIQKIVQPLGRTIDASQPMVDARLHDGSRINAIIPPLSLKGPVLTIRKFKTDLNNIEDLLRNGTMTNDMAKFLEACVKSKLNILVCGGTGSGKTTILNILSSFISDSERIITIEDAAELKLKQSHVISLETRISNYDSKSEVTIRDLVRNSLRMRPDRIIVGEVRGSEAFDMLQAMNTGHDGSLTTLHANGSVDALNRLETMVLMSGIEIPVPAIRDYIENAIDIVINVSRLSDGRRKITEICEIDGFDGTDIKVSKIFVFEQTGLTENYEVDGEFKLVNKNIKSIKKIKNKGIDLKDIFGDSYE